MLKNIIISILISIIVALIAPFANATIIQCIIWFIVNVIVTAIAFNEFEKFIKKRKKRADETTLKVYHFDRT